MTVVRVRLFQVPLPEETWLWLALEVEDGRCGWGELWPNPPTALLGPLVEVWAAHLAGRDPRRLVEARIDRPRGPLIGPDGRWATVTSAVDQAMWDLYAQAYGVPLAVALGGFGRTAIPLYANLNRGLRRNREPAALAARGEAARAAGFTVVKCAPFDEVRSDVWDVDLSPGLARLEALAAQVPWDGIAIDCHDRFRGRSLYRLLESLPSTPYWIEDPLPANVGRDWSAGRALRPALRWAAGEQAGTWAELDRLRRRGVEVLTPDLIVAGGVSTVRAWLPVLEGVGVHVSLHNPWGPVATAHAAHVMSLVRGDVPLEWAYGVTPYRAVATRPAEPVRDGFYHLPSAPGIGLAPDPAFLMAHGQEWRAGAWQPVTGQPS